MNTRRDFLKQASILAVTTLLPEGFAQALISKQIVLSNKFSLGLASADVTSDSVILWTCYTGFYALKVCVWTKDRKGIWAEAPRGDGGYVQMEMRGLSSGTRYQYAFSEIGPDGLPIAQSEVAYFKTAPAEKDLVSLRFGAVSCVKYLYEAPLLEQAATEDFDFFMFNGDNSYNDGMTQVDEFRGRWAQTLSKKGCLALRRSTSMISTIDDHDIENNFDMETIGFQKFEAGRQTFFEHMPMRRNATNPNQIWRQLSWGKTLDIFVLDCRTERRASTGQYLSRAQMRWLKEGLAESRAMFKVIMNSVPISEFSVLPMAYDRWEGFPEQRQEILEFIDSSLITNLLWISGDFHFTSLGRVSNSGAGFTQREVLAGPGAQISNPAGYPLKLSPQFEWVYVANSYIAVNCDVERQRMEVIPKFLES